MRTFLVLGAILGLAFAALAVPPFSPPDIVATVIRVVDGDTIEVRVDALPRPPPPGLAVGLLIRVRYIGVDAPELDQPQGQTASALNSTLVGGRAVYLELDERAWDDHGRLLAYVYLDSTGYLMVNLVLVMADFVSARTDRGAERYQALFTYLDAIPGPQPVARCEPVVPWNEARTRIGETLCVEGPIASVGTSAGGDVFLNLGFAFPNPGRFTLFIPARYVGRFEAQLGAKFWTKLKGTVVRAYGEVKLYQGIPEIQLSDPAFLFLNP